MKYLISFLTALFAMSSVYASTATDTPIVYKTIKNISYVSVGDTSSYRLERCKLDVYYPEGKMGYKTIVWFHGGGLSGGEKFVPREFCNKGYAVIAVNYRLFPRCKNPDYTKDAAAAVAWTFGHIANYGGDAHKIYVAGHSAGGYLTLMLAMDKSYLGQYDIDADSVAGYFPISGQTATHFTIRQERKIPMVIPIVDKYAPLNNARLLHTDLVMITGDRHLEMAVRYEENLYLKAVLETLGNKDNVQLYEINGFNHVGVLSPACQLICNILNKKK